MSTKSFHSFLPVAAYTETAANKQNAAEPEAAGRTSADEADGRR